MKLQKNFEIIISGEIRKYCSQILEDIRQDTGKEPDPAVILSCVIIGELLENKIFGR